MFNNRTRRNKTYKYNAFSRIKGIKKAFIRATASNSSAPKQFQKIVL